MEESTVVYGTTWLVVKLDSYNTSEPTRGTAERLAGA